MSRDEGLPDWLLLPPGPRDGDLAATWSRRPRDERLALARAAAQSPDTVDVDPDDRALVTALAAARVATRWRLHLAAAGLGWLVLMTIWGFGRALDGGTAPTWLAGGLVAGLVVAGIARRRVQARVSRARAWTDAGRGAGPSA